MNLTLNSMAGWFGYSRTSATLAEVKGNQDRPIGSVQDSKTRRVSLDDALHISAVWACIERRANTIASLPLFTYERLANGQKQLARGTGLYVLLHDSPNARMTSFEFWRAMIINHDLRGNAYARLERNSKGEVIAMWPMPADQVSVKVLGDGSMTYEYRISSDIAILSSDNVLHIKNLGNGTIGMPKLDLMQSSTAELLDAQDHASQTFSNGGKPTGVLMLDSVLKAEQRKQLQESFSDLALGSSSKLRVLEANMKYQQLSMSPADLQLLEARKYGTEEICRWFDVPPVLIHHTNVTTWGSGIEQIVDGFHKLTIRPMLVSIEQAIHKRVLTSAQKRSLSVEFSHDALLRGNIKDRYEVYSKGVQNGILTRNEARQLENLPPAADGDALTAQVNLAPLAQLGKVAPQQTPIAPQTTGN
jgi:HK97 family phage portal protein